MPHADLPPFIPHGRSFETDRAARVQAVSGFRRGLDRRLYIHSPLTGLTFARLLSGKYQANGDPHARQRFAVFVSPRSTPLKIKDSPFRAVRLFVGISILLRTVIESGQRGVAALFKR